MVFFVLSTAPQSGFGTFFLPLQLGASNMAFPRLTAAGFWMALTSFLVLMAAFFVPGGASGAGWTQYPPLSALASAGPGQGLEQIFWLVSIGLFCLSSLMSAVGFVATTIHHRNSGHDMAAHAADLLELVCYVNPDSPRFRILLLR